MPADMYTHGYAHDQSSCTSVWLPGLFTYQSTDGTPGGGAGAGAPWQVEGRSDAFSLYGTPSEVDTV